MKQSYIVMVLGKLLVWEVHWTSVHEACAWRGIDYDYGLQNVHGVRVFFFSWQCRCIMSMVCSMEHWTWM